MTGNGSDHDDEVPAAWLGANKNLAALLPAKRYIRLLCSTGEFDPTGTTVSTVIECNFIDERYDLPPDQRQRRKTMLLAFPIYGPQARKIRVAERCRLIVDYHSRFYVQGRSEVRSWTADAEEIEKRLRGHDLTEPIDPIADPRGSLEREIVNLCDGEIPGFHMIRKILSGWVPDAKAELE